MELVTGDGRAVRSGARTVKNVTGYDMHRLATGSLGTLGVIVQVALKVRPLPESRRRSSPGEGGLDLGRPLLRAVPPPAAVLAAPDRVESGSRAGPPRSTSRPRAADERRGDSRRERAVARPGVGDAPVVVEAAVPRRGCRRWSRSLEGWTARSASESCGSALRPTRRALAAPERPCRRLGGHRAGDPRARAASAGRSAPCPRPSAA